MMFTITHIFHSLDIKVKQSGDASTDVNPEYQFPGYLYCDGAEYNISDFPALYRIIGNEYGGEPRPEISVTNGGSGYDTNDTIVFDILLDMMQ